ncbi:hypothetical protein ACQFX9_06020 [Aliinostoc sp. HNIBRCY26]|uniref:hypothetical protein n=1 Tax=Aliinostoc sp. HNIBRCY26 TaxID=3418997 RepID=UPI003D022E5D
MLMMFFLWKFREYRRLQGRDRLYGDVVFKTKFTSVARKKLSESALRPPFQLKGKHKSLV